MPINSGSRTPEATARQANLKINDLIKNASSDSQKYAAAVEQANNDYQGQYVDKNTFKKAIDNYYSQMGASKTGREMRGENAWTDFVQGTNDFIHGINTGIGNGIDWVWDNTVGNLAGLAGKEAGDAVKNFMTGEDLSIIPDIASDVLLTIPGWTIPLVVAKEAFRNADNFNEAISGKDSVTLEELDDDQRAAKAALGTLGVGLSAVPGIGKAKSIAELASKKNAGNAIDSALENLAAKSDKAGELTEAFEQSKKVADNARTAAQQEKKNLFAGMQTHTPGHAPQPITTEAQYKKALQSAFPIYSETGEIAIGNDAKKSALQALQDAKKKIKTTPAGKTLKESDELLEARKEAEKSLADYEAARKFAEKSTAGRIADLFNEDVSGFTQAIKNIPETWAASRGRIGAEKQLKSAMREANKGLTKKSEASETQAALRAALGEDADDVISKTGYDISKASGKFKPGLPSIMPQFARSIGDVAQDVGLRSNASLLHSKDFSEYKNIEELIKAMQNAEEGSELEKALARINLNAKYNPTGSISALKSTLMGQATSLPMIPLAFQAEYGGRLDENLNRIAADIDANGPGKYIAAAFPVGGQRMLAQSALPGITGKLNAYHPFGAIRAKETARQFEDAAEQRKEQHTYEEAYNNIMGRK